MYKYSISFKRERGQKNINISHKEIKPFYSTTNKCLNIAIQALEWVKEKPKYSYAVLSPTHCVNVNSSINPSIELSTIRIGVCYEDCTIIDKMSPIKENLIASIK